MTDPTPTPRASALGYLLSAEGATRTAWQALMPLSGEGIPERAVTAMRDALDALRIAELVMTTGAPATGRDLPWACPTDSDVLSALTTYYGPDDDIRSSVEAMRDVLSTDRARTHVRRTEPTSPDHPGMSA